MSDFNKPIVGDTYANWSTEIKGVFADLALLLDPAFSTPTNLPTNAKRWNSASGYWEVYNGSNWSAMASTYNVNVATADKLKTARSIILTGNLSGSASFDGSANASITANLTSAALLSIAGLTTSADKMIYTTGANTYATTPLTANARTLLDDNTEAAMRATLGIYEPIGIACSDETTPLEAGNTKVTFRMPFAYTLSEVRASLSTPQTSGALITVDINEGGTSVLGTKLTIDNNESTSVTAANAATITDTALADDAQMTIDLDQIGDGTAKGLKVWLIGRRSS